MEKYTGHTISDESTLRKNYVSGVYEETISKKFKKLLEMNLFGLE